MSTYGVSNPLAGMMTGEQLRAVREAAAQREEQIKSVISLSMMLVGTCLAVVAGALAWGWPGGLGAAGVLFFLTGVLFALTTKYQ